MTLAGSNIAMIAAITCIYPLVILVSKCNRPWTTRLRENFEFSAFFRVMISAYFKLNLAACLYFRIIEWESYEKIIESSITLLTFAFLIIFPFYIITVLSVDKIETDEKY